MQEKRGNKIHNKRPFILQPCSDHKRRWRRRRSLDRDQGFKNRLARYVKKLGTKLAKQLLPQRSSTFLQSHHQRRPHRCLLQRGSFRLVFRTDLCRWTVPLIMVILYSYSILKEISAFVWCVEGILDSCGLGYYEIDGSRARFCRRP